ncbi:MAG: thioredoxin family protein [Bacteroidetes bacterium]|jgi:thiol-disulfide isomerase/thioredoxin|nr:thioredoxin family protein [Bacteroidota bacterium]MBT6686529.1 thioredoxin family protein [Bacteroidota bacterium]MBT7141750.1 thioredoxin family protein [Bacteroidota bacterium]MBT7493461.1 thioredoxin family protein [Bacteroidota bacterium]
MPTKLNTEQDYKDFLSSNKCAGVYYSSGKCGVCKTIKPQVIMVFEKNKTKLAEIVVDEHRALAAQQLIMTSPTVIFYENGKEMFRESGFINLQKVNRYLNMIIGSN